MSRYTPSLDLSALSSCDLIIEAVFEDMDIKKSVFSQLDKIAKPGAIPATNLCFEYYIASVTLVQRTLLDCTFSRPPM